ncbi:MAG: FAD-binding oxidoreductase [Betaproteobacteria bacterium]|nr:MAG: FAD-binding oxidoreductase [Betaproteobacteria bacterium]
MEAMIDDLVRIVGDTGVLTAADDVSAYVTDCRNYYKGTALCVVRPRSVEEVASVVACCVARSVPIQPQGGNTSLCGGSVPFAGGRGVVLSLSRMRRIREVDAANNSITVEAGCVLAEVQRAAVDAGRFYPVSLGAEGICQIGGNIATNAGGTGVLRYGNTRENVLGLEVVLPDATIWHGLRSLRKNNTGFDLKHLFIGSEGLLGIITAATLKLHPLNTRHIAVWLAPVSLDAALELLNLLQSSLGAQLSAFELMNAAHMQNVLALTPGLQTPVNADCPWHVLAELGDDAVDDGLRSSIEGVLQTALSGGLLTDAAVSANETQRAAMWHIRHSVTEATQKAGRGVPHDIAVPVSKVPEFVRRVSPILEQKFAGMRIVIVAHLGDGNLHFLPLFDFDTWDAFPDPQTVIDEMHRITYAVAAELGGTFSAEHGIGQYLLAEMRQYKSEVELNMMRSIKNALDPRGLFNPAKVLP